MKKTFYQWIIKQNKHLDVVGDFARDVKLPPKSPYFSETPKGNFGYHVWKGHLEDNNACDGALNAFERAFTEYFNTGLWKQ